MLLAKYNVKAGMTGEEPAQQMPTAEKNTFKG